MSLTLQNQGHIYKHRLKGDSVIHTLENHFLLPRTLIIPNCIKLPEIMQTTSG